MKKLLAAVAVLAVSSTAWAAAIYNVTPPSVSWTYTWDFTGANTAGWTLGTAAAAAGQPNAGQFGVSEATAAGLHLVCNGWGANGFATLAAPVPLNGRTGGGFMVRMDFVPNIGTTIGTKWYQDMGFTAERAVGKGICVGGRSNGPEVIMKDQTWDNTLLGTANLANVSQSEVFILDYGYTTPNKFNVYAQKSVGAANTNLADGAWCLINSVYRDVQPTQDFVNLRLGNFVTSLGGYGAAYGDMTVRSVQLYVPEPGTIGLLALGLIGLLRRR